MSETTAESREERLEGFILAILDHGTTLWANTACGQGGVGGQAMTTTAHPEVIQHLAFAALRGQTLKEAADDYAVMWPNARRLDGPPGQSGRAGPDGRPA
jgi:hypothetical protein